MSGGRRRRPSITRTRAIGLAILILMVAAVALAYTKPPLFASGQNVRMLFSDVSGFGVVGRDVEVAGAVVGSVTGVQREGSAALVTASLQSGIVVHRDATAELRPHLPFEGTAYIDLRPGSPGAPALGDRILPLSHTQVYVPVDEALRVFTPTTRAAARADFSALAATLSGSAVSGLQATLRGAPALTRTLAPAAAAAQGPTGTELAGAVAGLAQTMAGLDRHAGQLAPIVRQAAATMAAVGADAAVPLDRTVTILPGALASLDSGSRALTGILTRLTPLASVLHPGLTRLAQTLAQTRPLLLRAAPVLGAAPPLLASLRSALGGGADAAPGTVRLLRALSPSLTLLHGSLLPALLAPTAHLHIPAYLSFVNLFEGGGGASAPFQTAADAAAPGQTGIGHFMRFGARFFTGAGLPLPPCSLLAKASPALAALFATDGVCQS
ncbi:MAG TPA: MlaD family protein [Solirubrobacteraceae bacterium]|nr:MlaD family protein [Solirubrobacteraceae bacterium]